MSIYKRFILTNTALPWRLRHGLEQAVETQLRARQPAIYRWLHFGRARDPLVAITAGPKHHFFGYYEKSPWNASETLLLAHEADFNDRPPGPDDACRIGVVHPQERRFKPLARSLTWNWQQGAMLAWHPADPERTLVHNDREAGAAVGIVRDITGRELRRYPQPLYALSPDGRLGWSLNFARLARHRPGYGYAGIADPYEHEPAPAEDGLHLIELESGRSELIVSLRQLAGLDPKPAMAGQFHWLNHVQPSPRGSRIAFFHLWREGDKGWGVRLYTCRPDGGELFSHSIPDASPTTTGWTRTTSGYGRGAARATNVSCWSTCETAATQLTAMACSPKTATTASPPTGAGC